MSKLLITKDYERFVFDALSLNETDFVNYYLNIFAEHFKYNSDIFEQLETVINRYIDWYKSIVYGRLISVTWYDGTEKIMYENQTWSKNESGEIKMHDLDKTQISLRDFNINRHIDKSFFDKQIKIIHDIEAENKKIVAEYKKVKTSASISTGTKELLSFKSGLSDKKFEKLHTKLVSAGYIASETDFNVFCRVFSGEPINNIMPVQWIKKATRNKQPAKKALIELLILLDVPKSEYEDKKRLELCFIDSSNKPLIFTGSNFYNNKDNKNSEFYSEIQTIVKSL
jgi:hypothetical protein